MLYVSGYTEDPALRASLGHRAVAFLPKPFSPQALARKVREVMEDRDRAEPSRVRPAPPVAQRR